MKSKKMEENLIKESQHEKDKKVERIRIINALKEIPKNIKFLESARHVTKKNYQLFIGDISFEDKIKDCYNIYHDDSSKYNFLRILPYGAFYDEMYILENKKSNFKICLFLRIELDNIYYKKIPLVKLYKQKSVRVGIGNVEKNKKCIYASQIMRANFQSPNIYLVNQKIQKSCLEKSYSYITNTYLKSEVIVEELCKSLDEDVTSLESCFKNIIVKKAYDGIINTKAKEYRKKIEEEGIKLIAEAKKKEGKKQCNIYIILNNESHYLTCCEITAEIVNIDFFIKSKLYNKHETFCLYENKKYKTDLGSIFKISLQDLI